MLRITEIREVAPEGSVTRFLRLEGNIQGEWVNELRRVWRSIRRAEAGARISVVLADVPFVDAAGRTLLTEMRRDDVELLATDSLTTEMCCNVTRGSPGTPDSGGEGNSEQST